MIYIIRPLHGDEFKVWDEVANEIIAIFFSEQDAIDYVNFKTKTK
jgi:hypothetical protein